MVFTGASRSRYHPRYMDLSQIKVKATRRVAAKPLLYCICLTIAVDEPKSKQFLVHQQNAVINRVPGGVDLAHHEFITDIKEFGFPALFCLGCFLICCISSSPLSSKVI